MSGEEQSKSQLQDRFLDAWWVERFDELDREIARLSVLCRIRILDPGVIERVIKNDASVCGTRNPAAFTKLHGLLILYFAMRNRAAEMIGQAETAMVEDYIVERLKKSYPDLGKWPPV